MDKNGLKQGGALYQEEAQNGHSMFFKVSEYVLPHEHGKKNCQMLFSWWPLGWIERNRNTLTRSATALKVERPQFFFMR